MSITKIIETLIGSLSGFIFAIILFYISKNIEINITTKRNKKYLKNELIYNLQIINDDINNCKLILKSFNDSSVKNSIFYQFRFLDLKKTFINKCFDSGLLFDLFTENEINNILGIDKSLDADLDNRLIKYIASYISDSINTYDLVIFKNKIDLLYKYLDTIRINIENYMEKI
jgi:hypothetical protein